MFQENNIIAMKVAPVPTIIVQHFAELRMKNLKTNPQFIALIALNFNIILQQFYKLRTIETGRGTYLIYYK